MRYVFLVLVVLASLGCSRTQLPTSVADECLALCEAGALCSIADGVSCDVTCGRWMAASERYSCEAQLEEAFACAEAEGSCGGCLDQQHAWAQCVVDGTMLSVADVCNTWTCMSWPVSPTPHDQCVGIQQEYIFLQDDGPESSWIERSLETDDCTRCTEEHFGPRQYGDCSFDEAEWKTTCPVCRAL